MAPCPALPLLLPGTSGVLAAELARYGQTYDESFAEVHARVMAHGAATKADVGALIFWKHIQNAPWMTKLLLTPDSVVRATTAAAFAPGLDDRARLSELSVLPGCASEAAISSVLLAAFDPTTYGVYDRLALGAMPQVLSPACSCDRAETVVYFEHLRLIASELNAAGAAWTPRMVDMALFKLGGG